MSLLYLYSVRRVILDGAHTGSAEYAELCAVRPK